MSIKLHQEALPGSLLDDALADNSFFMGAVFGGLTIELTIDYTLRMSDGGSRSRGIALVFYYGIQVLLFLVALPLVVKGCQKLETLVGRIFAVAMQCIVGFCVYMAILFSYVLGYGLDSL